jgi:hypothetical protein
MYGKAFESMYDGSMYGAGCNVFAVWNYIIAKTRESTIELNPKKLMDVLGGTESEIISAVEFLCRPDSESRSKDEEGRKIVKEGQFQYRVVNWAYYQGIKNEEARAEYNRMKQREYRARIKAEKSKAKTKPHEKNNGRDSGRTGKNEVADQVAPDKPGVAGEQRVGAVPDSNRPGHEERPPVDQAPERKLEVEIDDETPF